MVRVTDGDTLKVQRGGKQETIRFCGIDAPELAQPLGKQSRDYLKRLVDKAGSRVIVQEVKRDRYDRIVGEVFVAASTRQQPEQERLLDYEQVAAGMAYVYTRYVKECPNGDLLSQGEAEAKRLKKGVWGNPKAMKPWDYRRLKR